MSTEKDRGLTHELGYKNWIDSVVGEAVMLGEKLREPELVLRATKLAKMARETGYYSDAFSKVQAEAIYLEGVVSDVKNSEKNRAIYIDELYEDDVNRQFSSHDWEYSFMCVEGVYEIRLDMFKYYSKADLQKGYRPEVEVRIRKCFGDPTFSSCRSESKTVVWEGQDFVTTKWFDQTGRLLCKAIDHRHEPVGEPVRGHQITYYIEDFDKVSLVWEEIREVVTSSRKR